MVKKILRFLKLRDFICGFIQYSLIIVGYIPSNHIRKALYKYLFRMKIGKNSNIHYGAKIRAPWNISIGNNTIIGDGSILDGRRGLKIGNNVNFSTGVWIWTLQHDLNSPDFNVEGGPVIIEDYAWISCRVVVLPNIKIGEGAVVAAGAIVTKDVSPFTVVGGVPAKKIGERKKGLRYKLRSKIPFI